MQKAQRLLVLSRVLAGKLSVSDAALLLKLSARSVRRLTARLEAAGPEVLVHGNRGRKPAHALAPKLKARIVELARTTYAGVNDSHLAELLAEREGIRVSRRSVQRILRAAGIKSPRKHRPPKYRARRERRAAAGMLVQLDGSPEDWFGTGERSSLLAVVDDATGDVLAATFRAQEDVRMDGVLVQLPPLGGRGSWAHQRVEVRQYLDGSCSVHAPGGRELARSAVPKTPPKLRPRDYARAPISGVQPLPKDRDHPWRRWQPGALRGRIPMTKSRTG